MISGETYALVRDEIKADQSISIEAKGFSEPITAHAVRIGNEAAVGARKVFERELQAIRVLLDQDCMPSDERAAAALQLREMADRLVA